MIHIFCPDLKIKSSGIRVLYRHVEVLIEAGFSAAVLHQKTGFQMPDSPAVPIGYLDAPNTLSAGDIVVIPEGIPSLMQSLREHPLRKIVIAMSWSYIFPKLEKQEDWRTYDIEHVITNSPFIADLVRWSMQLPTDVFVPSLNPDLYFVEPVPRLPQVVYIERKKSCIEELKRILSCRNPAFLNRITWIGLSGLTESEYAEQIRRSALFLNLSEAEGLPYSLLEAMKSGTLVAGFNSVGGQRELIGSGESQNCILAETLDYITLAQKLEPFLQDVLTGKLDRWSTIRENGLKTAAYYSRENEKHSIAEMWTKILSKPFEQTTFVATGGR